jgi:hypothetical protein
MSNQLISCHQPSPPLRQDLELLGEMRSHIANLETIYDRQEQEILRKAAGDRVADRKSISQIVSQYKAVCAVRDLEISVPDLFNENLRFWFHVTRLRLAWFLRVSNVLPDFRHALAGRSVLALAVLSPRLLDVL